MLLTSYRTALGLCGVIPWNAEPAYALEFLGGNAGRELESASFSAPSTATELSINLENRTQETGYAHTHTPGPRVLAHRYSQSVSGGHTLKRPPKVQQAAPAGRV